jgi:hypothetical protein
MLKKKPYRAPATMPMTAKTGTTYFRIVMAVGPVLRTLATTIPYIMPSTARNPKCR